MSQQAHRLARRLAGRERPDEHKSVLSDPAVDLDILVGDRVGKREGRLGPGTGREGKERFAAPVERPSQVDRGGAGGVEAVPGPGEGFVRRVGGHPQGHCIGGGGPDEGSSPHPHVTDGDRAVVDRLQLGDPKVVGEPPLVDDPKRARVVVPPERAVVCAIDLHAKVSSPSGARFPAGTGSF